MIVEATRNEEFKNKTLLLNNQLDTISREWIFFEQEIMTDYKEYKRDGGSVSLCCDN